jgi:protease I
MSKKILMIIAPKNFRDEELQEPMDIFLKNGFNVTVASVTSGICTGMFGAKVKPDINVDQVNIKDYDALVVVGGAGSPVLKDYPRVIKLIQEAVEQNKLLASICLGPTVLAKAGVLKGKKATVFSAGASEIKRAGAIYIAQPVVVDGKLITADGPESAAKFGEAIVKALKE